MRADWSMPTSRALRNCPHRGSAHADQEELRAWIAARGPIAGSLFLGQGEPMALQSLKESAAHSVKHSPLVAQIGEHYELRAGRAAKRTRTGLPDLRQLVGRDWQNSYAELAMSLKHRLQAIESDEARRSAIREIERVLRRAEQPIKPHAREPA